MKVLDYDEVDPVGVFHLTMLALGFALTPEHAAHIRRTDPRPFPCLAVCAVEDDVVVGHVGVFRLPMITIEGREDVGGVWAVSTHPQYEGRGVASRLLEEAHTRMRAAGLRFSTLGTDRFRGAYRLYRRHGYEDMHIWATALASWETAHQPTRLRAEPTVPGGHDFVEQVYANVASHYLGFAWRHTPFACLRDKVKIEEIHLLWENDRPVGYALTSVNQSILYVSDLLLKKGVNPAEAVAAVASRLKTAYVQVKVSRPVEIASLRQAGYHVAHPDWSAFMVKPLVPGVTVEDARCLFGVGTDRFLISWLDTT
jgi:GNAT superfamily N-acetyltransferase